MKRIAAALGIPAALCLVLFFLVPRSVLVGQQCPQGYTLSAGKCIKGSGYYNVPLTNTSYPTVRRYAVSSGNTDLLLAPSGYRVLIGVAGAYNNTAGTINWYAEFKSGGSYYRLISNVASLTHANSAIQSVNFILEPGESIAVNTDAAGLNVTMTAMQFSSANGIKSARSIGLSTGDNVFYTVPAGKTALGLNAVSLGFPTNTASVLNFITDSGGTRTPSLCEVASGGATTCAANSANEIINFGVLQPSTRTILNQPAISMSAGDFLIANVDTGAATQVIWLNVLEF